MPLTFRPVEEADFARVAELLTLRDRHPITEETLRDWQAHAPPERVRQRLVAVDELGQLIGLGDAGRDPWMRPGRFWLTVIVDPAHRKQGLGTTLYEQAAAFARAQGGTELRSEVRDDFTEGRRFMERHGFALDRHIFLSKLELEAFDEKPFAGALARAEAEGIRFFTLGEAGDREPANRRKLYDLNHLTALDNPSNDGTFLPFEAFEKMIFESAWYRPEGQILAAAGERWVGLAAVAHLTQDNSAYNAFTGVDPAYRGRGIAQALKLLGIRCARNWGTSSISTDNDSQNGSMLAINRKLGYQPQPGMHWLKRSLT